MNLLFVSDYLNDQLGGAEKSTKFLIDGFIKKGYTIFTLTADTYQKEYPGAKKSFFIPKKYSNFKILNNLRTLVNLTAARKLHYIYKKESIDIIVFNNCSHQISFFSIFVSALLTKKTIKVIRDIIGLSYVAPLANPQNDNLLNYKRNFFQDILKINRSYIPLRGRIVKFILRRTPFKVCLTDIYRDYHEQLNIKITHVIPNIVPLEKKIFRYDERDKVILFPARLSRNKGLFEFLKINNFLKYKILITMNENEFLSLVSRDQFKVSNLEFIGFKNWTELKDLYKKSILTINPTLQFESFGRVPCESLSLGTPYVSSPFGGLKEVLDSGKGGYLVSPFLHKEFSEACAQLIESSDLWNKKIDEGRSLISTKFNEKKIIDQFEKIFS